MKRFNGKTWVALLLVLQLIFTSGWMAFAQPLASEQENDFVYVSDMTPQNVVVGYDSLRIDQAMSGSLSLRQTDGSNKTYAKGMFAHAPSELTYNIEGLAATRFTAICGINTSANATGSCEFIVKIDDVQQLKTPNMLVTSGEYQVDIAIPANAKKLTLISTWGSNNSNNNDHSVWVEPKLWLPTADVVTSISVTGKQAILPVGASDTLRIQGKYLNGSVADLPSENATFTVDDPAIASVDAQGVVTALAPGKATVTVSYPVNGSQRTATYTLVVPQPGSFWQVEAPNGGTSVQLTLNENGTLGYQANRDGQAIVTPSSLGIKTSLGDFSTGLTFQGITAKRVEESYTLPSGKYSTYTDDCQEAILAFTKGEALFLVHLRVYEEGYAFRYTVDKNDGSNGSMTVSEETSTFALPAGSNIFGMESNRSDNVFNHEENFAEKKIEAVTKAQSMPMLYQSPAGLWTLISEADLYSDPYCGAFLGPIGSNTMKTVWAPFQSGAVQTVYPFTSPWRFVVSGSLGDIVESAITENLNPANTDDTSWVEPGVTAWTWLVGGFSMQYNKDAILQYVDFAAEMGWKYFILDEGWQPRNPNGSNNPKYLGYYEWFDEVLAYAKSKGVGLIAWILADDLNTPAKREVLKEYADKGIVGIKVDFFDSESQQRIQLYKDVYDECYAHKLLVNAHGANKPTGENRTYPNILNREAVRGEEYGGYSTYQTTIWPFTRGVVGPMDVTPRIFPNTANTTTGQQLAMNIMYESGMPCMASSIADYKRSPGLSLLKNLPSAWDDIHYIDGYPGKFATLARRSGDLWYAASIANAAQDAVIPLDFLGEEEYYAVIYRDGAMRNDLIVDIERVTKGTVLTIPMSAGGGCSVKLASVTDGAISAISLPETAAVVAGENIKLDAVLTPSSPAISDLNWSSGNPAVATVSNGQVTGLAAGQVVITASSALHPEITASCLVSVSNPSYIKAEGWTLSNPSVKSSQPKLYPDNLYRTTLKTLSGDSDVSGNAQNVFLREAPKGDFTLTLKVSGGLSKNYQGIALTAYANQYNVVSMIRRYHTSFGNNCFELFHWNNTDKYIEHPAPDSQKDADAYLKLERKGNTFTGSYSYDNVNWTVISQTITSSLVGEAQDLKIGLYALAGQQSGVEMDVTVENFTLNGEVIPFFAYDDGRTVVIAAAPAGITVPAGTPFAELPLPSETEVYVTGGQTLQIPVVWQPEGYDANTPGSYTLTGVPVEGEQAVNPRGVTTSITVEVTAVDKITVTAPDSVIKNSPFAVELSSSVLHGKLTLINEEGRKLGVTVLSQTENDKGGLDTFLSLSLGTVRENAVITVYDGTTRLGAFQLSVVKVPTSVYSVNAPESAAVNETFRVEVHSTTDLTKGKFFGESDKVIGSTRVSRVVTGDFMVSTYELKVGTAGEREITFRGAYDKTEDWGFDQSFQIRITK